jgi:hypothetical protein
MLRRMGRWANAVAIAALALAVVALWRTSRVGGTPDLEGRVAALEQRPKPAPLFAPSPAGAVALPAPAGEVTAKMEELHQRLAALEAEAVERRHAREEQDRRKQEDLKWARSAILDRAEAPERRLKALKMLRSADERTHVVALATLELLQRPDVDTDTRSDLISELKGVTFPEVKAPILAFLTSSHEDTRNEAVQVLRWYFDDPAVVAAVTRIRDQDPSQNVRRQAARRLEEWTAGRPPGK